MKDETKSKFTFGESTRFTFPIVVALLGLCAWLTVNNIQGNSNTSAITEIKTSMQAKDDKLTQLSIDVGVMGNEVHEINMKVDQLQKDFHKR